MLYTSHAGRLYFHHEVKFHDTVTAGMLFIQIYVQRYTFYSLCRSIMIVN